MMKIEIFNILGTCSLPPVVRVLLADVVRTIGMLANIELVDHLTILYIWLYQELF